jgi:hypothetical protein
MEKVAKEKQKPKSKTKDKLPKPTKIETLWPKGSRLTTEYGQMVFIGDLIPFIPLGTAKTQLCEVINFSLPNKKLPTGSVTTQGEDGKSYVFGAEEYNLKFE